MDDDDAWYFCVTHHRVEHGDGRCRSGDVLGPYPDQAGAAAALDTAADRTEAWEAEDRRRAEEDGRD